MTLTPHMSASNILQIMYIETMNINPQKNIYDKVDDIVTTFKLSCIMTYRRPGVSLSINSFVASGVTSLGVKPVPPSSRK